jgi:diguanylate cyclase (GGDEF)-like protein
VAPHDLDGATEAAGRELSLWADQAFLLHEANERDLKEIVEVIAKGIASVEERDERHALEVGELTGQFRSLAEITDLATIRRSILEQANSLTACVARMAEEGRQALSRLGAEVEDYRLRLIKSELLLTLDPLTGLANRRCFDEQLKIKIRGAKRFCLILIDLDGFKEINDRFGHLAGDEVLKQFAANLQRQFPAVDLVARWGGDEFAVILTTSQRDAEARVHRIRRSALAECKVNVGGEAASVLLGASIGVVEWDGREDGPAMLARADRVMYLGKSNAKAVRVG